MAKKKEVKKRVPKQPLQKKKTLPVDVNSFFRNGKRVEGYKRHKAGDRLEDEKEKKK